MKHSESAAEMLKRHRAEAQEAARHEEAARMAEALQIAEKQMRAWKGSSPYGGQPSSPEAKSPKQQPSPPVAAGDGFSPTRCLLFMVKSRSRPRAVAIL